MRGHGLYICVGLNIPCVALSTQDKVSGFARACGLDDYLVDVADGGDYMSQLKKSVNELNHSKEFRNQWYTRRTKCVDHWADIQRAYHSELKARWEKWSWTKPPR